MHEEGAQPAGARKRLKRPLERLLVFERRRPFVRESLPELGREQETFVVLDAPHPAAYCLDCWRIVKSGIDFDGVKELRKISGGVKAAGLFTRIDNAFPVGIRPPGRADANARGWRFLSHIRLLFAFSISPVPLGINRNSNAFGVFGEARAKAGVGCCPSRQPMGCGHSSGGGISDAARLNCSGDL